MGRGWRRKRGYMTARDILGRAPRSRREARRAGVVAAKRGNERYVRRHGPALPQIIAARPELAPEARRNSIALTVQASIAYLRLYHPAIAQRNGWLS